MLSIRYFTTNPQLQPPCILFFELYCNYTPILRLVYVFFAFSTHPKRLSLAVAMLRLRLRKDPMVIFTQANIPWSYLVVLVDSLRKSNMVKSMILHEGPRPRVATQVPAPWLGKWWPNGYLARCCNECVPCVGFRVGVWGILDISCQLLSSNHPFLRMFICLLSGNPSVLTSSSKANGDNIYTPQYLSR